MLGAIVSDLVNIMSLVVQKNVVNGGGSNFAASTEPKSAGMSHSLQQWLSPSPKFEWVCAESSRRDRVEKYIEQQFESTYGAKLTEFLPIFLTLSCGDRLSATAGIALGGCTQNLFLEQYLDQPIESELENITKEKINRKQLVEIGNLVATTSGASRLMLIILASVLSEAGYDWMVFTATKPLLHSLHKLGFETHVIAQAKPARLSNNFNADWGSYYYNQPQVVAGRLSSAQQIVVDRSLFNLVQSFYKSRIDTLASKITESGQSYV